jgi:putative transcriptional regulator
MDLTGQFLIAMPSLADPNFHHTVTYMCAHNDEGAMGIVINRPLGVKLVEVLDQMSITASSDAIESTPVYQGGPVQQDRGFVLHRPPREWDSAILVNERVGVATSRDILQAIADGSGPSSSLVALGYAGWAPGQLEEEVANNAWLNGPADLAIMFEAPIEQRWQLAAAHLGVDLAVISSDVGHA